MSKQGWVAIEDFVLQHDYGTGCGVCVGVCPVDVLEEMRMPLRIRTWVGQSSRLQTSRRGVKRRFGNLIARVSSKRGA